MFVFSKNTKSKDNMQNRLGEKITLNQFFDEHYYPHIELTKRQPKHDWSVYNSHIRRELGHYFLNELTNPVLDVWVREQVLKGLKRSTVNKHIHLFNRLLNLARHWTFLPLQSQHQKNIKKLRVGDHTQRFLSDEEMARLLKASQATQHPYYYCIVRLFLMTGARHGELRLAKWNDIDFEKRIWTIPHSKNGRARRIILSTPAIETFHQIRTKTEQLLLPTTQTDYVITNPQTRTAYHSFYGTWFIVRRAAKLDDLRIHDLRHTFASVLVNKGVSIYEVQTLLGHSSVQMTQRYAHLAPDTLQRRAELVGDIIDSHQII
jgi:integrase